MRVVEVFEIVEDLQSKKLVLTSTNAMVIKLARGRIEKYSV